MALDSLMPLEMVESGAVALPSLDPGVQSDCSMLSRGVVVTTAGGVRSRNRNGLFSAGIFCWSVDLLRAVGGASRGVHPLRNGFLSELFVDGWEPGGSLWLLGVWIVAGFALAVVFGTISLAVLDASLGLWFEFGQPLKSKSDTQSVANNTFLAVSRQPLVGLFRSFLRLQHFTLY